MDNPAPPTEDEKQAAKLVLAAALRHDASELKMMRESGINLNARDCIGETALHYACTTGDLEAARVLLDAGAEPGVMSNLCQTPLGLAMVNGFRAIAELLLLQGADPDQLMDTDTAPLTLAANSGDADMTRLLMKHGASQMPRKPSQDLPAIVIAAREGCLEVLKVMIEEFSIDVDFSAHGGYLPLPTAISHGRNNCVDYLLEKGARIDIPSSQGLTPIFTAACADNVHAIDALMRRGVPVDGTENPRDATPLMSAAVLKSLKAAKFLLDHDATIDTIDADGINAREHAVLSECPPMVALIDAEERRRHLIAIEKDAAKAHAGVVAAVSVRKPLSFRKLPSP